MLKGMAGSVLGVWTAHGEGRLHCNVASDVDYVINNKLAPLRYVDDEGKETEVYREKGGCRQIYFN